MIQSNQFRFNMRSKGKYWHHGTDYASCFFFIFAWHLKSPWRLSENAEFLVFNDQISTGGETASFVPTLTRSAYAVFGTISALFIIVKVGARSPRPDII
jgi:hypothetical protein